jgi:hypothetical protein
MAEVGPGFRGCNQIAAALDKRCASFEASLREAPQDDEMR